jgi:hypothetical protein
MEEQNYWFSRSQLEKVLKDCLTRRYLYGIHVEHADDSLVIDLTLAILDGEMTNEAIPFDGELVVYDTEDNISVGELGL